MSIPRTLSILPSSRRLSGRAQVFSSAFAELRSLIGCGSRVDDLVITVDQRFGWSDTIQRRVSISVIVISVSSCASLWRPILDEGLLAAIFSVESSICVGVCVLLFHLLLAGVGHVAHVVGVGRALDSAVE